MSARPRVILGMILAALLGIPAVTLISPHPSAGAADIIDDLMSLEDFIGGGDVGGAVVAGDGSVVVYDCDVPQSSLCVQPLPGGESSSHRPGSLTRYTVSGISGDGRFVVFRTPKPGSQGIGFAGIWDREADEIELFDQTPLDGADFGSIHPSITLSGDVVYLQYSVIGQQGFQQLQYFYDVGSGEYEPQDEALAENLTPSEMTYLALVSQNGYPVDGVLETGTGEQIEGACAGAGEFQFLPGIYPTDAGDVVCHVTTVSSQVRDYLLFGPLDGGELEVVGELTRTGCGDQCPGGLFLLGLASDGSWLLYQKGTDFEDPATELVFVNLLTGAASTVDLGPANGPASPYSVSDDGRFWVTTDGTVRELRMGAFPDVPTDHPFYDEITWLVQEGITTGFPDGDFKPRLPVARQAMAAFIYRYFGSPEGDDPECTSQPFSDVPQDHQFCGEIAWLSSSGITGGYGDGTFKPSLPVARQAMAAFLYRMADSPEGDDPECTSQPFSDVPQDHQFCGEIAWLSSSGITGGYGDGTFKPSLPVARQAMAAFLFRLRELSSFGSIQNP